MDYSAYVAYGGLLAASVCFFLLQRGRKGEGAPFPPGPRRKLLIGNMLDIPIKYAAEEYIKWNERYGGMSLA